MSLAVGFIIIGILILVILSILYIAQGNINEVLLWVLLIFGFSFILLGIIFGYFEKNNRKSTSDTMEGNGIDEGINRGNGIDEGINRGNGIDEGDEIDDIPENEINKEIADNFGTTESDIKKYKQAKVLITEGKDFDYIKNKIPELSVENIVELNSNIESINKFEKNIKNKI